LGHLDKVVDEHVRVSKGLVERAVGRRGSFFGFCWQCLGSRHGCERLVGKVVFLCERAGFPGHIVVVQGSGFLVKAMRFGGGVFVDVGVGDVANGFGHDAEGWRRLDPTHGAGERNGNELGFSFVFGQH
jgi:hypothetical protein